MQIRKIFMGSVLSTLLALGWSNAIAQELTKAAASDSCTGFSLRVIGEHLTRQPR